MAVHEGAATGVDASAGLKSNGKDSSNGGLTPRPSKSKSLAQPSVIPDPGPQTKGDLDQLRAAIKKKYRHIAAVHSKTRPSTLSHDSEAAPSFLGFRNLMVIVLGMFIREKNQIQAC
jgi:diacylglycerol O-acyltransferase-1